MEERFNIFKRDYNLYQYYDILFLFYNTYGSILKYNQQISNFSLEPEDYDIDISLPDIAYNYKNAFNVLSKYKNLEIKIISTNNIFLEEEAIFFVKKLGYKTVEVIREEEFENKSDLFFQIQNGKIVYTDKISSIYYIIFIKYLNHIIKLFSNKTTLQTQLDLTKLLIYLDINLNIISNNIKTIHLNDQTKTLAYKIFNKNILKTKDNRIYTITSWKDRYIQQKHFFEGTVMTIDGNVYTTEIRIDNTDIVKITDSNKILSEVLISMEHIVTQESLLNSINNDFDFLNIDLNECIEEVPNWNLKYYKLPMELINIRNKMKYLKKEELLSFIKKELTNIINNLDKSYKNSGVPLGICPSCNKGYIWKGHKAYFCDKCENFLLWNKALNTSLGFVPNKYQIKQAIKSNNFTFKIKRFTYKLFQVPIKKNNKKFWKIIKI
jgi:hypothetical protein